MTDLPIRDAASVVLLRDAATAPKVLMGQRGKDAAFMPNKFVFPGGAVDPEDASVRLSGTTDPRCLARMGPLGPALLAAAIRETWEETGLILGAMDGPKATGQQWATFSARGFAPCPVGLRYFFRAITPPARPRRFDARFFLVDAGSVQGDLDDFSSATDELRHLHWVPLSQARALNLPFITEVVLAEVEALAATKAPPDSVPFFDNSTELSRFERIS